MKPYINKFAYQLGKSLRDLTTIPEKMVDIADETLKSYADKKMDTYFNKVEEIALQDARYAEIESMRKIDGSDNIIMMDERLGFPEMEYQSEVRRKAAPEPLLMPFYRYLYNHPVHSAINTVKHAVQRLTRSWDDTATWSLDYHLCLTLGSQLKHLAETTHGWPQSETYPEFEDWQKALNTNSQLLLTYTNKDDIVFTDNGYDREQEEQIIKNAQKALRWVAKHLPSLWD